MTTKNRFEFIIGYFKKNNPDASTELRYKNSYELIVAVILSAQCTDKRVNVITPAFFEAFPDFKSLSIATPENVFLIIKSCSYPNNKTKNLIAMAQTVVGRFGGQLPEEVAALEEIPGVGRKTANVLASVLFNKPVIAVDTHVFRVSARIGLTTNAKNPHMTEMQLNRHIPGELRALAHHWLILHGRYVCTARSPKCHLCGVQSACRYFEKLSK